MPASPDFLRRLPKAELHCHLEGSVPAATAVALARAQGVALPVADPADLYRFSSLEEFLDRYVWVSGLLTTADDFAGATYAALTSAARDGGLRYREMSFNPTNHPDLPYSQALAGVRDGAAAALADAGVTCRFVVAVNREQGATTALDLVREVLAHPCEEVVAVGLDHNELAARPGVFREAFALAASAGLHRTAHAGERGDATEVVECLDVLGVQRIDHGYAVLSDPALVRRLRDAGTHLAACWSTSVFHGPGPQDGTAEGLVAPAVSLDAVSPGAVSPVGAMLAAGLAVSVNSDDPPMFGTDIGTEFVRAGRQLGWTREEAADVALAGLRGAFLPEEQRRALVTAFEEELAALAG